jgi:hypothetical protein
MGIPFGSEEQRIGSVGENKEMNATTPTGPTSITVAIVKKWLYECKIRDKIGRQVIILNKLPMDGATARGIKSKRRAAEYVHMTKSRYRQSSLPKGP